MQIVSNFVVTNMEAPQASFRRAFELSKGACDAGNADGCFWAAFILRRPDTPSAADQASAFGYLRRGCRLGDSLSFRRVADAYIKGEGVAKDVAKGIDAYTKACEGDDGQACNELVTNLKPSNPDRALAIALKSCKAYPQFVRLRAERRDLGRAGAV